MGIAWAQKFVFDFIFNFFFFFESANYLTFAFQLPDFQMSETSQLDRLWHLLLAEKLGLLMILRGASFFCRTAPFCVQLFIFNQACQICQARRVFKW